MCSQYGFSDKKNKKIKCIRIYQNILRLHLEYGLRDKDLVSEDLHNETYQRNTIVDSPVYCCLHIGNIVKVIVGELVSQRPIRRHEWSSYGLKLKFKTTCDFTAN